MLGSPFLFVESASSLTACGQISERTVAKLITRFKQISVNSKTEYGVRARLGDAVVFPALQDRHGAVPRNQ